MSEGSVVILVLIVFHLLFSCFWVSLIKDLTVLLGFFKRPIFEEFHCSFLLHICFLFLLILAPNFIIYFHAALWVYSSIIFQVLSWIFSSLICSLSSFLTFISRVQISLSDAFNTWLSTFLVFFVVVFRYIPC